MPPKGYKEAGGYFGKEKVCPICGKTFLIRNEQEYVYKRIVYTKKPHYKTVFVHTWSCLLRLDEKIKAKDFSFLDNVK